MLKTDQPTHRRVLYGPWHSDLDLPPLETELGLRSQGTDPMCPRMLNTPLNSKRRAF